MDLLAATGLRAAVIPHYDNAEGGNHDTRFCYLGERRVRMLESMLEPDTVVLGVDENTACLFYLDADTATVLGRGRVAIPGRPGRRRRHPGARTGHRRLVGRHRGVGRGRVARAPRCAG